MQHEDGTKMDSDGMKEVWAKCMEELLNVKNV